MTRLSKPVATIETLKRLVTNSNNKYATKDSLSTVATTGNYSDLKGTPTSLPANGGNASTVNGHTVLSNVPANAKFTDTVYSLPDATASVKGGVKVGSNITVSSGTISLTKDNVTNALGYTPPTTDTNTHYTTGLIVGKAATDTANAAATNGNVFLNLKDDSTIRNSHKIVGSGATTVTSDASGNITISSTNTVYTHPTTHPASMITGLATVATSGSYNDLSNKPTIPTTLPANGGNSSTVNGHTVNSDVPANAKFTDTVYTHPNSGVTAGTYKSVTVNAQGHVTAGTNPTTLSGYGITDAKISNGVITLGANSITPLTNHQSLANYYTKSEVNSHISSIPKFAIAVVTDLPTSNISNTTIYLKKTGDDTQNLYTEYIYVNSKWEQLGTQKLDLSGYLTKADASNTYLGKTATATKAKADDNGNNIRGTYLKSISYNNATRKLTSTRGDNATFPVTLPQATSDYPGLVQIGNGLRIDSGILSTEVDFSNYITAADIEANYLGKTANAVAANKLTVNAGSVTVPTYFANGVPTACTGISVATVTATTTLNIPGGKIWIE